MGNRKLFQHIASEKELSGQVNVIEKETLKVFDGSSLFQGLTKTFVPLVEGLPILPGEQKEVVTTVGKRLRYHVGFAAKMFDYELVRDAANQKAKADLVIDGKVAAKDLPVTFLLSAETRMRAQREIFAKMPALDMSRKWEKAGNELWKHGPNFINREEKKTEPVVMYHATKEHPAQIKEVVTSKVVARFDCTDFSGAVHPGLKAAILERMDKVIEALKAARLRANELEVEERAIGDTLFEYILSAPQKE
jgi:hypothetical protein